MRGGTVETAAKGLATKQANGYATGFRIDDRVAVSTKSKAYDKKTGRVVTTNLGEVGVSFSADNNVDAWFLPTELTRRSG